MALQEKARHGDRDHQRVRGPAVGPSKPRLLQALGPRPISSADDDDPAAVAICPRAGECFVQEPCRVMPLAHPPAAVVREAGARVGRTAGQGLAATPVAPATVDGRPAAACCRG